MSKKVENINVEVNEITGKENPTWEVVIPKKKTIGLIEKTVGRYRATSSGDKNVLFSKSFDGSVNDLLAYYALHEK